MINLFLRNFDAETEAAEPALTAVPAEPAAEPPRLYAQDELDRLLAEARATALAEGRAVGATQAKAEAEASQQARAAETLEAIRAQLSDLVAQDDVRRRDMERDLVDLLLDVGERAVPDLLDAYSADLALARIRAGYRMASGSPRLTIRVSPGTEAAIGAEIAVLDQGGSAGRLSEVIADPSMRDGDARLEWENGFLDYSLDRVCNELLDALRVAAGKMKNDLRKAG